VGFLGMFTKQLVQRPHAEQRVRNPLPGENRSRLVEDADVVVGLGPIHSDENHVITSVGRWNSSLEGNGSELMDQCSRHDTPPAFSVILADRLGHDLAIELTVQFPEVLTSQRLGGKHAPSETNHPVPLVLEFGVRVHVGGPT
jgi:hypothetical protein